MPRGRKTILLDIHYEPKFWWIFAQISLSIKYTGILIENVELRVQFEKIYPKNIKIKHIIQLSKL